MINKNGQLLKQKLLKNPTRFSARQLAIFAVAFGLIGGLVVWRTFASAPVIASLEAERMNLPAGASIITDSGASGGQAVQTSSSGNLSGSVMLPSDSTSLSIIAKSVKCKSLWPTFNLSVDGSLVLSGKFRTTSYTAYSVQRNLARGNHTISLDVTNSGIAHCHTSLYLDVSNFYGNTPLPPPPPTLSFSASPQTVSPGQSSTLTWNTTNATSCTANGAWSGSQPTSGSVSTGALNVTATYGLVCTGSGGSVSASATVGITQPVQNYPPTTFSVRHFWAGMDGTNAFKFSVDSQKLDDFIAHAPDSWTTQGALFKQYQPNGRILFYQNFGTTGDGISTALSTTQANASGWLATHNGVKIPNPWGGSNMVIDLGKPGVAAAYVTAIEGHYQGHPWNGIFADDVNAWYNLWSSGQSIDGYSSPSDYWTRAVLPLMQYVNNHLKTDKNAVLIPNIGDWALHPELNNITSYTDGGHNEFFLMWNGGSLQNPATIENEYNSMKNQINTGKIYYGIIHRTDLQGLKLGFCAAAIMGGDHPNLVRITNQTAYGSQALTWDSSLQTNLGTPTNAVVHTAGSNIWSRSFSGGKTLTIDTNAQSCSGI